MVIRVDRVARRVEGCDQVGIASGMFAHTMQNLYDSSNGTGSGVHVINDGDAVRIDELGHAASLRWLFS